MTSSGSRLRVVVDSSSLRQTGGNVTKGDWPSLRAAARLGRLSLHLPSCVLQELVDLRTRDLKQLSKLERDASMLRTQLFTRAPADAPRPLTEDQIVELVRDYRDELTGWFADAGSVLDEPHVSHTEIVERILAKRRPFNESERGYRDALIWYSTLECAAESDTILLTANTKDFASRGTGDDEHVLAEDLQADVADRQWPPTRVTLVASTSRLLARVLPDWGKSEVREAWSSYITSESAVAALDQLLNNHLGHELLAPPRDVPQFLWSVGVRSVDAVSAVHDVRLVDDGDGWYRVHARVSSSGRVGGYAWTWGDPDASLDGFALWDDWGGLTEYFASDTLRPIDVVVAARFRPLLEVDALDIVEAWASDQQPRRGDDRRRVQRALRALLFMLQQHIDNPSFIADVLSDHLDEFSMIVRGVISEWESLAESVPGRYVTLVSDNLPTVLADPAGLQALRRDLEAATAALDAVDESC